MVEHAVRIGPPVLPDAEKKNISSIISEGTRWSRN